MHLLLRNDDGELLGDLYMDRETQTCQIMFGELETLGQLVQIAKSQGVPEVALIAPTESIAELAAHGWTIAKGATVMTHT